MLTFTANQCGNTASGRQRYVVNAATDYFGAFCRSMSSNFQRLSCAMTKRAGSGYIAVANIADDFVECCLGLRYCDVNT